MSSDGTKRVDAGADRTFSLRIDERLRNWGGPQRRWHDAADASRVDAAWRRLGPRHRDILRMVYLWRADREVVCRRLKIPRRPAHLFNLELRAAQIEIEKILRGQE